MSIILRARPAKVTIHRSTIAAMWMSPSGQIHRHYARLQRATVVAARVSLVAHGKPGFRTGELYNSIRGDRIGTNAHGLRFRVHADAPHAVFVIGGTRGPIRPRQARGEGGRFTGRPSYLPVGKSQGGPIFFAREVRGQSANPFLERGLADAMRRAGYRT